MSQGLNKVKRRIAIVENTRKITNAMKLISSVKLRQVQNGYDKRISFYDDLNDSLIHKDFIGDSTLAKMLMYGKEASNRKQ